MVTSKGGDVARVRRLEQEINLLLDHEAQMWSQRSKIQWLRDGDRNTWYFHSKASERRRRNYIKGLYNREGRWCTDQSSMVDTVVDFYQDLCTSSNPTSFETILEQIPHVVTGEMNSNLMGEFTAQEVEVALKQMALLKSPGPDGMPLIFYQNYWSLVGNDVTDAILMYLNTDQLNSNNIMVAFETLYYMRNHSTGKTGFMALKLDMSKAYDRVEWLYMEKLMKKMGFCEAWVKLMMGCISTATYSILINGEPQGNIVPTRGFVKETLSPHIFFFYALRAFMGC
nr:uncharacterized protein LOC111999151 [Quercus suber]